MPKAVRKSDLSAGHGCFPARINISGSPDVMINGLPAHRKDDKWLVHICGKNSHDGTLSSASTTVFANNKGIGRVGDSISCGDTAKTGSPDTFIG